jgi:hypothetical protein
LVGGSPTLAGLAASPQAAGLPANERQIVEEIGARQRRTSHPQTGGSIPGSRPSSLATTRWPWVSCKQCTGPVAGCQKTWLWGFDNIPESAYFWPALTTVDQPLIDLGCLAVEKLSQIIDADYQSEGNIESESICLQPELVVRESTMVRTT